jgi:hypothetical protein
VEIVAPTFTACYESVDATISDRMATLSQLVTVLARVTGLPEATVFAYGRFAREAGLIAQGGRGLGGAQMTPTDATNLLLAIGGTRVTRDAEKAIRRFRTLPGQVNYGDTLRPKSAPRLSQLLDRYQLYAMNLDDDSRIVLGRFIDFLIDEACSGELEKFLRTLQIIEAPKLPDQRFYEATNRFHDGPNSLPFKQPADIDLIEDIGVSLSFEAVSDEAGFHIDCNRFFTNDYISIVFGTRGDVSYLNDLSESIAVSQRTIFAVGACLNNRMRRSSEMNSKGPKKKLEV